MSQKVIPQTFIEIAEALSQKDYKTAESWFKNFTNLLPNASALSSDPAIKDFLVTGFLAGLATGRWQTTHHRTDSPFIGNVRQTESDLH
jgi:hypothetical protein